jgi:hypothetical protein
MPINPYVKGGTTDVPVVDGGTGASTAAGARTNLMVLDETAHDLLDHTGLTGIGDLTTAAHASLDHSTVPMARRNIGTATTAVASGDFAAGDGSHEIFWDASAGSLSATNGLIIAASGANSLTIQTNSVERARITNSGTLQVGDGTLNAGFFNGSGFQSYNSVANNVTSETYAAAATTAANFTMKRGRGTPAAPTDIADGDILGNIAFQGLAGVIQNHAYISAACDGSPGLGNSPGRLMFYTTPVGSSTLAERVRINNIGTTFFGDGTLSTSFNGNGHAAIPIIAYRTNGALIDCYSSSNTAIDAASYRGIRSRGTVASPSQVSSGDDCMRLSGGAYHNASSYNTVAEIVITTEGTITSSNSPGRIGFWTVPTSSNILVERWRIDNAGALSGRSAGSQLTWTTGLGAINHIVGPTDQSLVLISGAPGGASDGRTVAIVGGSSGSGNAGDIYIGGGQSTTPSGSGYNGGTVTIVGGPSPSAGGGTAGYVDIQGGHAVSGNAQGGQLALQAGNSTGVNSGATLYAYSGNALGSGSGGDIEVYSGAGGPSGGNSGAIRIRTGLAPAGTFGTLSLGVGNVDRWRLTSAAHLVTVADNTYDIGASGATRPRSMYVRTSFVAQGVTNQITVADGAITQSAGALGIGTTSGNITVSTTTSGNVVLNAAGALDLDAGTTVAIDAVSSISLDAAAASNFSVDGANLLLETTNSGAVNLSSAGAIDVQASTAVSIDSSGGAISVGGDANAFAINIGTGAAARSITIGNTTGATGIVLNTGSGDITISDGTDFVLNTTTGTKIGTGTTQKLGFWNAAPVVQSAVAAFTNNVTSGGTNDQIDDYTDLTTYANDATTIRNNFYQLGRKLDEVVDALRLYGLLG